MCCLEARELGFRTPTPVSHGRKHLPGRGVQRLCRHCWDCLTEASFTGLYTGSSLYGRRRGLSEQQKLRTLCKKLVKGTQDLAGPQCLGEEPLGMHLLAALGRAVLQNQGEVIWPKAGGKPSVGSVGARGTSCLGIPASQRGQSLASSPWSLPAWAPCSVNTFPPVLGCAWSPELLCH